ncbi:MAG: hypothetical protein IPM51_01615 [Sphingobacteriaceae bacterium]|nr:hypothetical protein [Sphingobacteriaceae bacterium]
MSKAEEKIPNEINKFLNANQVATVCFIDEENHPYCINCFYVYDEEYEILIFKSSPGTNHHNMILSENRVAGTILPMKVDVLKLKGIQFTAQILSEQYLTAFHAGTTYYKKNPFALAMPGYVWAVQLLSMKFTDNTMVFAKKMHWNTNKNTT